MRMSPGECPHATMPVRGGPVPRDPDAGAVDHGDVAVMRLMDRLRISAPAAGHRANRLQSVVRGAAALGRVAPGTAGPRLPREAIDHRPVIDPPRAPGLLRQQRLDDRPFLVARLFAAHGDLLLRKPESRCAVEWMSHPWGQAWKRRAHARALRDPRAPALRDPARTASASRRRGPRAA